MKPLRILAVSQTWQGANDYGFVRAFRRSGHSVRVINPKEYQPQWTRRSLKILTRLLQNQLAEEFNAALLAEARSTRPDMLFVFKGALIMAKTLRQLRDWGVICIQFYPDTGFSTHSPYLREASVEYDWFFTTKPAHVGMMNEDWGFDRVSFMPHGFDPETHAPVGYSDRDLTDYGCDVSFIGNTSAKKNATMAFLADQASDLDIRVWGPTRWAAKRDGVSTLYRGHPVFGVEYSKAITLSKVNLGLLFEGNADGAAADTITARTFEIPAVGGFMLHERTEEAEGYFEDGKECAFFENPEDLVDKIRYYLSHDLVRQKIAEAGRKRSLTSGYSTDDKVRVILEKYHELRN